MARNHRTRNAPLSLVEAVEAFILDGMARRLSPYTLGIYREKLTHFTTWAATQQIETIAQVDARALRLYLIHLAETGHNPGGQHTHARILRAWLNFLEAEGLIPESPMRRVKMPKLPKPIPDVLTREEVRALLAAAEHSRDKALILALLDTGARVSEFVALNVGDVDSTGAVQIHHGKGDKARTVYLGYKALKALRRWLWEREDPYTLDSPLWTSLHHPERGTRLTTNAVRLILLRLGQRANLKRRVSPHMFRRTFALWSLRSGMDIYTLARLMGHADIATLRHYLAIAEVDTANAHRRHGPVDGWLSKEDDS